MTLPTPQFSSVLLVGSTSGTITLEAPAIAGSGTVTVPTGSGAIPIVLTGTTGSIGGSVLSPGTVASDTVAIANATTLMVAHATPQTFPGDGTYWQAYISSAGTVTVNVGVVNAGTPAATAYNVRVIE